MDYIKTSDISDPNIQMPWTGPMIDFLLNIGVQSRKAFAYAILGDILYGQSQITGVVLAGGTKSGSGNTMFNGWIFYKDELYFFPGAMGLLAFANVPVFLLDETNDFTVGSVEFSDSIFRYVTKVRRLKVVDQLSGTGLFDMSTMGRVISDTTLTLTNHTTASGAYEDIATGSFTTPSNRKVDLEITLWGLVQITANGASTEGSVVRIYNSTGATILAFNQNFVNAVVPNGEIFGQPFFMKVIVRNVAAGTTIKSQVSRSGANNVTTSNAFMIYKEILRPAMW